MNKRDQVVFTSYFCAKPHPQFAWGDKEIVGVGPNGKVDKNQFSYIRDWYESLVKHKVKGVVFHDLLSEEFVNRWTNEYISFEKCNTQTTLHSNNDIRFIFYAKYLEDHKFEIVYLTDGSDVVMVNDPNNIIDIESADIFVCADDKLISKDVNFWPCVNHIPEFKENSDSWELLNMGVIGGTYDNINKFCRLFAGHRTRTEPEELNLNMPLGNMIIRTNFKEIHVGSPFTSEFKQHQVNRRDVCFRHK